MQTDGRRACPREVLMEPVVLKFCENISTFDVPGDEKLGNAVAPAAAVWLGREALGVVVKPGFGEAR